MANTFSQIYLHFVFSTKCREPFINQEIEDRVWAYLGGIARAHKFTAIQVGGMEDHAHVLTGSPTTLSPSEIARYLKGDSSKWIHEEFPHLNEFAWQDGYGVFSVSKSALAEVVEYIKNQREHHRSRSFEDEYRAILEKHAIDFDELYLLG
ncbi:MAG: IS200/IS605 family transposase [Pyrinomonadaceae bacterium]